MSIEGALGNEPRRLRRVSAEDFCPPPGDEDLHTEKETRRRQALEINDNIVQGLAVAKYAMDAGDHDRAREAIELTLKSARQIVTDLLNDEGAANLKLGAGDLVRLEPATVVLAKRE